MDSPLAAAPPPQGVASSLESDSELRGNSGGTVRWAINLAAVAIAASLLVLLGWICHRHKRRYGGDRPGEVTLEGLPSPVRLIEAYEGGAAPFAIPHSPNVPKKHMACSRTVFNVEAPKQMIHKVRRLARTEQAQTTRMAKALPRQRQMRLLDVEMTADDVEMTADDVEMTADDVEMTADAPLSRMGEEGKTATSVRLGRRSRVKVSPFETEGLRRDACVAADTELRV